MYNKLLHELNDTNKFDYVSANDIKMLTNQQNNHLPIAKIENRNVYLIKHYKHIQIVIYEGKHEMLTKYAFEDLIKK